MRMLLIRHGQTVPRRPDHFRSDDPLSYRGQRQARLTGEHLQHQHIDIILSSDLERAKRTALILSNSVSALVEVRADLREMKLGQWDGLSIDQVRQYFPGEFEAWQQDQLRCKRGGESFIELEDRVQAALHDIMAQYSQHSIAVVCHTGVIRAILSILRCRSREGAHGIFIDHCAITTLSMTPESTTLLGLNETAHLAQDRAFIERVLSLRT